MTLGIERKNNGAIPVQEFSKLDNPFEYSPLGRVFLPFSALLSCLWFSV